jgi:hypothetical protein
LIDLKQEYGAEYKIDWDDAANITGQPTDDRRWLQQIPAKYGHIYIHEEDMLGAHASGRIIAGKLAALPGVDVLQRGDFEVNVAFPPDLFPTVAALLQARKRRRLSPEQAKSCAARLTPYRYQKA